MKILLINPNISTQITQMMADEARRSASDGTEIVPATSSYGTTYVANRIEAAIGAHAVLDVLAEHHRDVDAAIVCAFGDPGVFAARELVDIPVVGVSEAAFLFAYTQGRRYSIVCLTERLRTWYLECAAEHGLDGRLASARALPVEVTDITSVKRDLAEHVVEQCSLAVREDRAEVIVLGGGPLAGLAREIAGLVPVPVIDGISCAVKLAESLVELQLRPPRLGSFARPEPKGARNLSPSLQAMLAPESDNDGGIV